MKAQKPGRGEFTAKKLVPNLSYEEQAFHDLLKKGYLTVSKT